MRGRAVSVDFFLWKENFLRTCRRFSSGLVILHVLVFLLVKNARISFLGYYNDRCGRRRMTRTPVPLACAVACTSWAIVSKLGF